MRPLFLNRPSAWLRVPRTAQTPIDTAYAIEHFCRKRSGSGFDWALVLLVIAFVLLVLGGWA